MPLEEQINAIPHYKVRISDLCDPRWQRLGSTIISGQTIFENLVLLHMEELVLFVLISTVTVLVLVTPESFS